MTSAQHPDDLLALYAVDALDGAEREAVEAHLSTCAPCTAEVAAHVDALAELTADRPPPDGAWDAIAGRLGAAAGTAAPAGPPVTPPAASTLRAESLRRRPLARWVAPIAAATVAAVAAVAIAAVAVLGGNDAEPGLTELAAAALDEPSATVVPMVAESGAPVARTVLTADGVGYVFLDDLEPLPAARVYQLWSLGGDAPVSLGLLGNASDRVAVFRAPSELRRLAISAEPARGSVAPTGPVVASGAVEV